MPDAPTQDTPTQDTPTQDAPTQPDRAEGVLLACALALAMVLGGLLWGTLSQPAQAEMVSDSNHLVVMTAKGGNEDVLYVLDNRVEQLMLYKVTQSGSLELVQRLGLREYFDAARSRRLGGD